MPENDYGTLALAQFQQSAATAGLRVPLIERYKPGAPGEAVQRLAAARDQFDAIFIPEQADAMASVSKELMAASLDSKKVQIIGTGVWNDSRTLSLPALQGAWFTAPENAGFNAFAQRYKAKFGSEPARIATLAYDAVSLAIALSRSQGSQRYSESVLTNPSGFNGADGVFRFKPDGTNERGLSVLEIGGGAAKIISPAPQKLYRQRSVGITPSLRETGRGDHAVQPSRDPCRTAAPIITTRLSALETAQYSSST